MWLESKLCQRTCFSLLTCGEVDLYEAVHDAKMFGDLWFKDELFLRHEETRNMVETIRKQKSTSDPVDLERKKWLKMIDGWVELVG